MSVKTKRILRIFFIKILLVGSSAYTFSQYSGELEMNEKEQSMVFRLVETDSLGQRTVVDSAVIMDLYRDFSFQIYNDHLYWFYKEYGRKRRFATFVKFIVKDRSFHVIDRITLGDFFGVDCQVNFSNPQTASLNCGDIEYTIDLNLLAVSARCGPPRKEVGSDFRANDVVLTGDYFGEKAGVIVPIFRLSIDY